MKTVLDHYKCSEMHSNLVDLSIACANMLSPFLRGHWNRLKILDIYNKFMALIRLYNSEQIPSNQILFNDKQNLVWLKSEIERIENSIHSLKANPNNHHITNAEDYMVGFMYGLDFAYGVMANSKNATDNPLLSKISHLVTETTDGNLEFIDE